ncbi:hypothetical protein [Nocardioides piscis]|uniref:Heparin-binding hemagglutinin n=1 Tax=Nocardioides piscis TaxID=2714938 RepID=A0A6G7YF42_9ACTN|nr:hypothetical protein [Nocardioides piscis]QIK75261.1 hypothetical protein G7071_07290 [Nocardioides piscis]
MAKSKFDIKTEATKPLYAGVGVTDLAVERLRNLVTETQTLLVDVQKTVIDPKARRKAIEARVAELQAEAKAYPAKVQTIVDDNVAQAADAYTDLIKRGESLVGRIRRQQSTQATKASAKTTVAKAKTTTTQAKKTSTTARATTKTAAKKATNAAKTSTRPAAKKASTTKSSAKATSTTATKTAANATKAVADATKKVGD